MKSKRKSNRIYDDKSVVLKSEKLLLVTEQQFHDYMEGHEMMFNKRTIGLVDRYYNDYGELLALQDGIDSFYLFGGYDCN